MREKPAFLKSGLLILRSPAIPPCGPKRVIPCFCRALENKDAGNQKVGRSSSRFFLFLVYLRAVPITIELPDLASQTKFNLARWTEILADPELAKLPYRIETDQHGQLRRPADDTSQTSL